MALTILCKDIISDDLETFKTQIDGSYNNDTMYSLTQQILLEQYGNANIRYTTAENFLNALKLRFNNVAPVYAKKFDILAEALDIESEYFIASIKDFTENKNNTIISNQDENRKDAETPTSVKASTDFIDKYTNSASKTHTNGRSEERGNVTHKETNTDALIDKIEQLNKWRDMLLEKYAKEFNNLFIQFY